VSPSILNLLTRLGHTYRDGQGFAAATVTRAAHRRSPEVVEAYRHPNMGVGGGDAICRVEADPAQVLDMGFRPGVTGLLRGNAIHEVEVASHVPCGNAEGRRRRDKNVGDVLTDAAPEFEGFRGGGGGVGRIGVEGDFAIERSDEGMQQGKIVATSTG